MPELPEIETIAGGLRQLIGEEITEIFQSNKKLRRSSTIDLQELIGFRVKDISRRARYLLILLQKNSKEELILLVHLGMSGRITICSKNSAKNSNSEIYQKHNHFICHFSGGKAMIFNDPRRFGFVDLIAKNYIKNHPSLQKLGIEPLNDEFSEKYLFEKLRGKQINIKTAMMDNQIVVGVGNIYINESLYAAGILPTKAAGSLKKREIKKLVEKIKEILLQAIKMGGSSISDYRNAEGDFGNFQTIMCVYGRENLFCFECKELIQKIVQNGRSTFFCKNCQK